jgi:hypothetical protein
MDLATMPDEDTDVTFGDLDFDTIEAAVMETARGRWFLKEYARRNRNADTQLVLEAMDRLKEPVPDAAEVTHLQEDLKEMASAIRQTKEEVRSLPVVDETDPLNAVSEAEFQAAAEQRIRRMVQTLNYLEGRIHGLMAFCETQPARDAVPDGASPFDGEKRAHSHPAFLM